jgi:hypothetical protein
MTELSGWQNFYVIVGSSAGALIGLQFVLITLIANIPVGDGGEQAGHAFATPTIVHFGAVLLLAGVMSAPWPAILPAVIAWGILGFGGLGYAAIVARRMRAQTASRPEFEDLLFHILLPLVAYGTLAASACAAYSHLRGALFGIGASALPLLCIGIHNAWDAATYHVFVVKPKKQKKQGGGE